MSQNVTLGPRVAIQPEVDLIRQPCEKLKKRGAGIDVGLVCPAWRESFDRGNQFAHKLALLYIVPLAHACAPRVLGALHTTIRSATDIRGLLHSVLGLQ